MHYLTYVFIRQNTDIEGAVAQAMEPFDEDLEVKPWKQYLDADEIAVMAKHYRVHRRSLLKLAGHMEDWCRGKGGVDAQGLFTIHTFNPNGEWDWYEIGGRWNGFLRNNVAIAKTLLKSQKLPELLPHDFLTPDGKWHAKARFQRQGWLGGKWVTKSPAQWLREFQAALKVFPTHRVICVDRHT